MTTPTRISVATTVFEPNCIPINAAVGKALYQQLNTDRYDDFLGNAHFTSDEKAFTIFKGERKILVIHGINVIVDEATLSHRLDTAFLVDRELWDLFLIRDPELAAL